MFLYLGAEGVGYFLKGNDNKCACFLHFLCFTCQFESAEAYSQFSPVFVKQLFPLNILLTQAYWVILHFYFEVEVVRVHLFLMEREGVSQVDVKMPAKVTRVESINIGSPMYMLGYWCLLIGYSTKMRNNFCMNDNKIALYSVGRKQIR